MKPKRPTASLPLPLTILGAGAGLFLLLPLVGLLSRVSWPSFATTINTPAVWQALWLSLWTATCAAFISLIVGVPLAWLISTSPPLLRKALRALVTLPLVLPPVVGGLALLMTLGRNGFVGKYIDEWWGMSLPFTPAAVIVAQIFVAMPFLVVTVEGAFQRSVTNLEEAALTLGASPNQVLLRVTLPVLWPSMAAGVVMAWTRALGEFGATITFAGSFPGKTQTLPIAVYYFLETNTEQALALGVILLLISLLVLVFMREQWWRPLRGKQ